MQTHVGQLNHLPALCLQKSKHGWSKTNNSEAWSQFIFVTADLYWTNLSAGQISTGQISQYISLICLHFHFLSWISISPPFQMSNSIFSPLELDDVTTHLTEEMGADWTLIFLPPHYPSKLPLDHNCCLPFSWTKWSLIPSKPNPSTTLLPSQGFWSSIQTPLSELSVSTSSIFNKYALDQLLFQIFASLHSKTCCCCFHFSSYHFLFNPFQSSSITLTPQRLHWSTLPIFQLAKSNDYFSVFTLCILSTSGYKVNYFLLIGIHYFVKRQTTKIPPFNP